MREGGDERVELERDLWKGDAGREGGRGKGWGIVFWRGGKRGGGSKGKRWRWLMC